MNVVIIFILIIILGQVANLLSRQRAIPNKNIYDLFFEFIFEQLDSFVSLDRDDKNILSDVIFKNKNIFFKYQNEQLKEVIDDIEQIVLDYLKRAGKNDSKTKGLTKQEITIMKEYKELGWKKLLKKYHPDYGGDEEIMKLINKLREEGYIND